MTQDEETRVVFEIGFAIEDPCDADSIVLARELLRFARRVPPQARRATAELLSSLTVFSTNEIVPIASHGGSDFENNN
jgi:hypothetical protein